MTILFLAIVLLLFVSVSILLYKIVVDLVKGKRSDWGINLSLPNCPKCGKKVPIIRKPTSTYQAMWGGWTCSNCGCEMDKWGKEINISEIEATQQQIREGQVNIVESFDEKGNTPVEKIFEEKNK